jgi:hypothetical protein
VLNTFINRQLGIGTTENTDTLTEVVGLRGKGIIAIAPGMHHTIALSRNGTGTIIVLSLQQ